MLMIKLISVITIMYIKQIWCRY